MTKRELVPGPPPPPPNPHPTDLAPLCALPQNAISKKRRRQRAAWNNVVILQKLIACDIERTLRAKSEREGLISSVSLVRRRSAELH